MTTQKQVVTPSEQPQVEDWDSECLEVALHEHQAASAATQPASGQVASQG